MMTVQKAFDALLVIQYRSGDKKAIGLLVKRHHAKLCRHAYWYTSDFEASKDIVQESWGIILLKLETLRDPNTFGSWAMRIVTRKSLDFLNTTKRKQILNLPELITDDSDIGEEKDIQIKRLKKAIAQLPDQQKVVLRLFYTEDYSLKEISAILSISEGTVKSRLYHAREKLKSIITQ